MCPSRPRLYDYFGGDLPVPGALLYYYSCKLKSRLR
jgi:hypothetical protein